MAKVQQVVAAGWCTAALPAHHDNLLLGLDHSRYYLYLRIGRVADTFSRGGVAAERKRLTRSDRRGTETGMLWTRLSRFVRRDASADQQLIGVDLLRRQHINPDLLCDPNVLCAELCEVIAGMPSLKAPLSADAKRWLQRAYTLVLAGGHTIEAATLSSKIEMLGSSTEMGERARQKIVPILNGVLAVGRLKANGIKGDVIPPGRHFSALVAFNDLLPTANQDILVIDPYLDEKMLIDFATLELKNVRLRLLACQEQRKASLGLAASRWVRLYSNTGPLEVRLASRGKVHDRLISIDGRQAWSLAKSSKPNPARAPASVLRVEPEVAALKVEAYEDIWANAERLR